MTTDQLLAHLDEVIEAEEKETLRIVQNIGDSPVNPHAEHDACISRMSLADFNAHSRQCDLCKARYAA